MKVSKRSSSCSCVLNTSSAISMPDGAAVPGTYSLPTCAQHAPPISFTDRLLRGGVRFRVHVGLLPRLGRLPLVLAAVVPLSLAFAVGPGSSQPRTCCVVPCVAQTRATEAK